MATLAAAGKEFIMSYIFRFNFRLLRLLALKVALFICISITLYPSISSAEPTSIRLSDWLAARGIHADDYLLGLMWRVPSEEAAQEKIRADLLKNIDLNKHDSTSPNPLHDWIATLPITGRVPISIVDADWLSANPRHNPLILPNHQITLPKHPDTVLVITSKGLRCQLAHVSTWRLTDYVAACNLNSAQSIDWVWVAQPDGKVKRFGAALWNRQQQDEPAPGAWIWAPHREDQWAVDLSEKMLTFFATQGISASVIANPVNTEFRTSNVNKSIYNQVVINNIITANDWGEAGLLQTPSARMRPESHASMTFNRTEPNTNLNVFLQPFDWMELGFRYTSVSNRLYGPSIAGDQAYKDKSIDLKINLIDESAYIPQLAAGARDITGTGLFSGEYVVANKRLGAFDFSLGMGWGYLGARGNLSNPLASLSSSFKTRVSDVGQGGNFALTSYFRGPTALFGGVQYQSPWEPLILKLEYDGNDYQHQPQDNNQLQASPWNVGVVYRAGNSVNLMLGFERGNTLMFGMTLQTELQKLSMPKLDDPAPIQISEFRPPVSRVNDTTARDLAAQTGWYVRQIQTQGDELRVSIDDAETLYWHENITKANAVLNRDAGSDIQAFHYIQFNHGVPILQQKVDRAAWVRLQTQPLPASQQSSAISTQTMQSEPLSPDNSPSLFHRTLPIFEAEPGMNLQYNLGGPDGFFLYQLAAGGQAKLRFNDSTWLQGGVSVGLIDNYNTFKYTAPSNLPRVRTYLREYLTSSDITMPNLQLTHTGKISDNQYFSAYAGYLETMFAGVGAEWMYRSLDSPVAFGIDINQVRQRDFAQDFGLREYKIVTGNASLYIDTGWNDVLAYVSAGRYLAGDTGVTIEMSRVFQNGVRFGGYFTKTNVSAAQFGEGSFDKGLYVSIPFDAMLTKSSNKIGYFIWKPLIRDGGAKLGREVQLYDMTRILDQRTREYHSADLENHIPVPSDRH